MGLYFLRQKFISGFVSFFLVPLSRPLELEEMFHFLAILSHDMVIFLTITLGLTFSISAVNTSRPGDLWFFGILITLEVSMQSVG